ncbi:MAG: biosynthetic-type acetolactate synthase large subunit [Candidatus Polarisedimenticolaceae bacterium]|nr:biosynthetic-type acetolactate synthase large subunit [Candidatus Polarisedimenticolaceae bacterium]
MELNGGEIIVECLKKEGVEHVFGYPGGAVLHIYDAIFNQDDIKHILVRHEQGATHAADGYARTTGKPGVVLVTSGPGATNAVTGIATAYMDSIPMIVITGQVPSPVIGSDAFQEVDTVGITRPCVKHNFLVKDVNDLAETFKKAFYIATTGRPGPVVIDVPKDITAPWVKVPFKYPTKIKMRSYNPTTKGHVGQIKRAVKMMLAAKRPVFYTGGGVVLDNAASELTKLVQRLDFPITQTLMGLGGYPATEKHFLGMLGMHGTYEANMAMHGADVLIAVGARFDDRITGNVERFCPDAKIIHIDIDPSSISKNVRVDIPIVGSVKSVLQSMNDVLAEIEVKNKPEPLDEWWADIERWRARECLKYSKKGKMVMPQAAIESLYKVTNGEAIVCSDVGQHQMFVAQFYKFDRPNRWANSGGLGTMGFGLPAAMGAQIANPDDEVVLVTGDASIQMCIQELSTCLQYNLPLKIVLLNNGYMGMVRQWQEFFYEKRYSESIVEAQPDFVKLVESYGHVGMTVNSPAELDKTMEKAFAMKDRLVLINVLIDPESNVYPMIEAGKGHNEMYMPPESELV